MHYVNISSYLAGVSGTCIGKRLRREYHKTSMREYVVVGCGNGRRRQRGQAVETGSERGKVVVYDQLARVGDIDLSPLWTEQTK